MSNDQINIFCDTINAFSKGLRSQLSSDGYKCGDVVYDRLDSIDEQVTALRQHQQDGGWLPISEAPKDGTIIMALRGEDGFSDIPNFVYWYNEDWFHYQKDVPVKYQPTHWQHRPPAPKKENDDG